MNREISQVMKKKKTGRETVKKKKTGKKKRWDPVVWDGSTSRVKSRGGRGYQSRDVSNSIPYGGRRLPLVIDMLPFNSLFLTWNFIAPVPSDRTYALFKVDSR